MAKLVLPLPYSHNFKKFSYEKNRTSFFIFCLFQPLLLHKVFALSDSLGAISDGGNRHTLHRQTPQCLPGDYNVILHNIGGTSLSVICSKEIIDTISGTGKCILLGAMLARFSLHIQPCSR